MTNRQHRSVDPEEIAQFEAISAHWWDPKGAFSPLHAMNPVRLGYIRDGIGQARVQEQARVREQARVQEQAWAREQDQRPLSGLRIADIGCGGGLLSEPLARMGASVTGIDASAKAIAVAQSHGAGQGLAIDYRCCTAETLAMDHAGAFDVVTALEIIEHVSDLDAFLEAVAGLLRPGGLAFVSTLNRTAKSYAMAIIGAEYVLGLLPRGTHDWRRFLRPAELEAALASAGLALGDMAGMVPSLSPAPSSHGWKLSRRRLAVNYIAMARKPA